MMSKEIEDFGHYVKLDVKKIDAVNQLQQLVAQNQIKKDHAEYVQQKFEDLRATLGRKLMDERRIINESGDLADQLKKGKEELKKLVKESEEDAVALELVKEDAEQADSEATLAREREQYLILELGELIRIRDEYTKKIAEIEHDHFTALAPIIQHMQMELKSAGEEIIEDLAKIETNTKELENGKEKLHHLEEELKVLKTTKTNKENDFASLDGVPEKYHKQCDMLINVIQSLRIQDTKWVAKVKEVEAAIQSLSQTTREKIEERAGLVTNYEKFKLLAVEKERTCADIQKEVKTASHDVEELLGDRVHLDMQIMGRLSDLKHESDILANCLKERDRAIKKLKEKEIAISKIQVQMPIFIQEKEKIQREFVLAEALRKKGQESAEEVCKDIAVSMKSFQVAEKLGKEVIAIVRASHAKVQKLEQEVMACAEVEQKQNQHVMELTNMCECLARVSVAKYAKWREMKDKSSLEENFRRNYEKRKVELEKQLKDSIALFHLVRSQRNKYASLVAASAVTIAEMKDRVTTLSKEVEQFQGEVFYKEKVLEKMQSDNEASVKGRLAIRAEITKCTLLVKEKKSIVEEQELEIISLEEIINKAERDMIRDRKYYGLAVRDRNKVGISLIDRNDELCILYEKNNVQVELLRHSEVELIKRIDEIDYLKREGNLTQKSILTQHRATPIPDAVYGELASLKEELEKASTDVSQLSELIERPSNLDRWHVLPGRDNNYHELMGKALAKEEFLSAKEDQAYEKDLILEEVTVLANELLRKAALSRPESIEVGQKINGYVRHLSFVTRKLMATVSELSLVQATSLSMKSEKQTVQINLDEAYQRLEKGQAPTVEIERFWQAFLREATLVHKMKANREALKLEDEREREAQMQKKPLLNTTAERRPNAYISQKMGLPMPFGRHAPFRPSKRGSTMRHFCKQPVPIET